MHICRHALGLTTLLPLVLTLLPSALPSPNTLSAQVPSDPSNPLNPTFLANIQAGIARTRLLAPDCLLDHVIADPDPGVFRDPARITRWDICLVLGENGTASARKISIKSSLYHWGEWTDPISQVDHPPPLEGRWIDLSLVEVGLEFAWSRTLRVVPGSSCTRVALILREMAALAPREITWLFEMQRGYVSYVGAQTGIVKVFRDPIRGSDKTKEPFSPTR